MNSPDSRTVNTITKYLLLNYIQFGDIRAEHGPFMLSQQTLTERNQKPKPIQLFRDESKSVTAE